jgi:hypothetical protein
MWNVLSLYRSGTLQNLIQITQEYKIDFLAVQEVRLLGLCIIEKYCRIHYCCDDKEIFLLRALWLVNILDQD